MRFIPSFNALIILGARDLPGSHVVSDVSAEEMHMRQISQYAKKNPYSVAMCPGSVPEAIEAKVRLSYGNQYESTHFMPMIKANI